VVLASLIGLALQIIMVVRTPQHLLAIQESVKTWVSQGFELVQIESQYRVAYNLIGGDNILVHTFFVLIAYLAILVITLPFRRKSSGRRSDRNLFS